MFGVGCTPGSEGADAIDDLPVDDGQHGHTPGATGCDHADSLVAREIEGGSRNFMPSRLDFPFASRMIRQVTTTVKGPVSNAKLPVISL